MTLSRLVAVGLVGCVASALACEKTDQRPIQQGRSIAPLESLTRPRNTLASGREWQRTDVTSPMDGARTVSFRKLAIPESAFARRDDDAAFAVLAMRCREGETDAFFSPDRVLADANGEPSRANIRWRIDSSAAVRQVWSTSTNFSAAFASDPRTFIRSLAKGRILRVEFTPSGERTQIATYDLAGTDSVARLVAAACKWKL